MSRADQKPIVSEDSFIRIASSCFDNKIRKEIVQYKRVPAVKAFLAERMFRVLAGPASERSRAMAIRLCHSDLVPTYKSAYAAAMSEMKEKPFDPILSLLGTAPIEHHNKFIQWTNNLFLRHNTTGHSELTEKSIDTLPSKFKLGKWSRGLIVSASQSPDIYRWTHERFHAHTKLESDPNLNMAIEKSKQSFVNLIVTLMRMSAKQIKNADFAGGLFWLGVACHSLQDLVYHRGMTLRQHAGLSYALEDKDPDRPTGELLRKRNSEAVSYCRDIVQTVLTQVGKRLLDPLLRWRPPPNFKFSKFSKNKFQGKEDMTISALYEYWSLADPYKSGERSLRELDSGSGLIEWDVRKIIAATKDKAKKIR